MRTQMSQIGSMMQSHTEPAGFYGANDTHKGVTLKKKLGRQESFGDTYLGDTLNHRAFDDAERFFGR